MSLLREMVKKVEQDGYSERNAEAKVCQDIVLKAIAKSPLSQNATIKGGVVMRSISKNKRRATQDIDFDFVHYSLSDDSIRNFIDLLNCIDGISIKILGEIEELSQQEYHGKRVGIVISDDSGYSFQSKIDLGVHAMSQITQEEYCFDVCLDDEGASLLINSKEQIFTEKLKSLLKFGRASTRYKDIFDLYFLTKRVRKEKLLFCFKQYIFDEPSMKENDIDAIARRIEKTFSSKNYVKNLENAKNKNWLQIDPSVALEEILCFLRSLQS